MPVVMIEQIFSHLSYDEISKNRLVCKDFDSICQRMLNRGFLLIERKHTASLKNVKAQLPRRESERRYHPLSRHCDILTSIETRISMLNMTYAKFIGNNTCCFIPGKVIDEIERVLHIVENSTTPPRAHEVLQELRDISSMAIEHFDEKISPALRRKLQESNSGGVPVSSMPVRPAVIGNTAVLSSAVLVPSDVSWRAEFLALKRRCYFNARLYMQLAGKYRRISRKMRVYKRIVTDQSQIIKDMNNKQSEQETAVAELKRRIEECDIKYVELTHRNQAVGAKAIAGERLTPQSGHQPLRHFSSQIKLDLSVLPIGTNKRVCSKDKSNIKPRKPVIKLPLIQEDDSTGAPSPKIARIEPTQSVEQCSEPITPEKPIITIDSSSEKSPQQVTGLRKRTVTQDGPGRRGSTQQSGEWTDMSVAKKRKID